MKKYIIIIGTICLVLNSLIGMLVSDYNGFNVVFVDVNIVLSFLLFFVISIVNIASNYKITLTITFIFTGFMRFFAALTTAAHIKDNPVIIGVLIIFVIEVLMIIILHSFKKIE